MSDLRLRVALLISFALISACGKYNYQEPASGVPAAEFLISSAERGGQLVSAFDNPTCAPPGSTLAIFNWGTDNTKVVRVHADKRIYVRAVAQEMTGLRSTASGSEHLSKYCNNVASFVPLANHRYDLHHDLASANVCALVVIDAATKLQPPTYEKHEPLGACASRMW